MNSTILGWKAKINIENLKLYKISLQYNYDYAYLCSSIRNGDFLSDVPFLIEKDEEDIILIASSKPSKLEIATIPITLLDEISVFNNNFKNLDMYIITAIYLTLSKHNYKRPNEILSFVGKSKGVASRRTNSIKKITVEQFNQKLTYNIFEAERFESHYVGNKTTLIFYDPRYEISEDSFNITSPRLIPMEIEAEVAKLRRNYSSAILRFNAISKIIMKNEYSEIYLSPLKYVDSDQINFPHIRIGNQTYNNLANVPIEKLIESKIEFDKFIQQIQIYIDKTGSNEIHPRIINFFQYFEEITRINVIFEEFDSLKSIYPVSKAIIICLDDLSKGSGYVYNKLKELVEIPNKVVRFSTILKEDWDRIVKLVWLSLRFRYTQSLYQTVKSTSTHQNSIALHLTPYLNGDWMILSGVSIAINKVNLLTKVFYNDRQTNLLNKDYIIRFLNELINFKKSSHFILEFSDVQLQPFLKNLPEYDYCLVRVNPTNSIFFGEINREFHPIDGLTTKISSNMSVLMTNGFPNNLFDGIPKPLLVKKIVGIHNLTDIVRDIFNQTFLNPFSIAKPKLPFCLGLSMNVPSEVMLTKIGGKKN